MANEKQVASVELLRCKLHLEFFASALGAYFFRALNLPDTTSESRRDGVKVAQDVSPGCTLEQNQKSPVGTAERCVR